MQSEERHDDIEKNEMFLPREPGAYKRHDNYIYEQRHCRQPYKRIPKYAANDERQQEWEQKQQRYEMP